ARPAVNYFKKKDACGFMCIESCVPVFFARSLSLKEFSPAIEPDFLSIVPEREKHSASISVKTNFRKFFLSFSAAHGKICR
ncbi:hypothetical protein, partial [Neglectibacter timonensis]|uniref:hypothetical protein n=1 Tax=Neglectibacter timonensis TaxID=1776382 RepID=UPI00266CAAFC